ncbi:hypothetical protein V6N11_065899 [Hibiscus sabdariffa]|uniref:Uncharacterized protein n=1 Tax=Hibiscus sabdariffa TaxID=183260 RepID=A0ABR2PJC6_9ROSI
MDYNLVLNTWNADSRHLATSNVSPFATLHDNHSPVTSFPCSFKFDTPNIQFLHQLLLSSLKQVNKISVSMASKGVPVWFFILFIVLTASSVTRCASVGHMPSTDEDATDYSKLKSKTEEAADELHRQPQQPKDELESRTQDKASDVGKKPRRRGPDGLKTRFPKASGSNKTMLRILPLDQLQTLPPRPKTRTGEYSAGKTKDVKDSAYKTTEDTANAAKGKASELTDAAKENSKAATSKAKEGIKTAKEKARDIADTAREMTNEAKERAAERAEEARAKAADETENRKAETEERLRWAKEKAREGYDAATGKAREGYDAAKSRAEESIESAKESIASSYESAKQKSQEMKDKYVEGGGRGRDEEL